VLDKPFSKVCREDWEKIDGWKIPSLVWTSLDTGLRPVEVGRAQTSWVDTSNEVFDTGGGYLLLRSQVEYDPEIDEWMPLETELLDVAKVTDWDTVDDIVDHLGFDVEHVRRLPKLPLKELE